MATANPLSVQGIHHLRHFRHLNGEKPAGADIKPIPAVITDAAANTHRVTQPEVYLLRKEGGESGESPKTDAAAAGYLSPPACGAVANGGEGGDRRGPGPALLAQLAKALEPKEPAADPSPPVISAARRLNLTAAAAPPPELLELLGDNKAELFALPTGNHCRCCDHPIAWPRIGAGPTYTDGTASAWPAPTARPRLIALLALEHWRQEHQRHLRHLRRAPIRGLPGPTSTPGAVASARCHGGRAACGAAGVGGCGWRLVRRRGHTSAGRPAEGARTGEAKGSRAGSRHADPRGRGRS